MSISINFTVARVNSIFFPSLSSVAISYSIGTTADFSNSISYSLFLSVNPGDPMPNAQSICDLVTNDLLTQFGTSVDTVIVDGVVYQPSTPDVLSAQTSFSMPSIGLSINMAKV